MNLEAHPAQHYLLMLFFYHVGLAANMLTSAYLAQRSSLNGVMTIKQYFSLRWIPIGVRWFACLCMFLVIWENSSIVNLEKFLTSIPTHMGVAGGLGVVSDVMWDKFLAIFLPGIQKELPPLDAPK